MKLISSLLLLSLTANFLFAFVIYVPEDYPTIQEGLYAASSGDTVMVAPGTYAGFMWSGMSLVYVHVFGSGAFGDSVTKILGNVSCDGIYLDDVVGWEVAGFEVTNFYSGIVIEHCDSLNIHHNYSHNNPYSYAYGFHLEFCENISFHHNVLAYNDYVDLRVHTGNQNISIMNNTIVHTGAYHGIMVMDYVPGFQITNNIIAYNSDSGVKFIPAGCQGDAILTYNDNFDNGINWNGCTPGVGNISLDPLFTNAWPYIYALQRNSPCIDAGDPNSPLDPDGTIADIGAFYFDQTLPLIENLTVTVLPDGLLLDWEDMPDALYYLIYRNPEPYFDITGTAPYDTSYTADYTDREALANTRSFYRVSWVHH